MERIKIPMLSRFDSISHIMPYYSQTHGAFLLLSSLWKETRNKLDEFYDGFVNLMKEHWKYIDLNSTNQQAQIFIPNDLFEVSFECRFQESIDAFIEFFENLRETKGWYFNSHYMHSKTKIRDPILTNNNGIKTLCTYVDVLKSTQVILCKKDTYSSKIQYKSSTLDTKAIIFCLNK